MSHKKFGPDRFSRFDVYWIQTDRQTNKQTDKPNLYIDIQIWEELSNFEKPVFDFSLLYPRKNGLRRKSKVCPLDTQIK